jgi:hypothetical protein
LLLRLERHSRAEERRQGTIELLLTWPVSVWQIAIGKFLAAWLFLADGTFYHTAYCLYGRLLQKSWCAGIIISGYLRSLLCAGACLGIASIASSLTRHRGYCFCDRVPRLLSLSFNEVMVYLMDLSVGCFSPNIIEEVRRLGLWRNLEPFTLATQSDLRPIVYFLTLPPSGGVALSPIIIERR